MQLSAQAIFPAIPTMMCPRQRAAFPQLFPESQMQIAKNSVVSIIYTLTNSEGKVLDSNKGGDALPYLHGHGGIIPGLEKQLEGKVKGDSLKVTVTPEEGYGVRDEKLVQKVPASAFKGLPDVKVGKQFQGRTPEGHTTVVTITAIGPDEITIDANHALAGVTLHFDITIADVRAATKEELAHGHVHGPGGHHHHH
jgi:FKBP-type peptidyl-prolyl cis-trans isomerase SlyD